MQRMWSRKRADCRPGLFRLQSVTTMSVAQREGHAPCDAITACGAWRAPYAHPSRTSANRRGRGEDTPPATLLSPWPIDPIVPHHRLNRESVAMTSGLDHLHVLELGGGLA